MKSSPKPEVRSPRPESGYMLTEALVYISLLFVRTGRRLYGVGSLHR